MTQTFVCYYCGDPFEEDEDIYELYAPIPSEAAATLYGKAFAHIECHDEELEEMEEEQA